jgi:hypothetical protein
VDHREQFSWGDKGINGPALAPDSHSQAKPVSLCFWAPKECSTGSGGCGNYDILVKMNLLDIRSEGFFVCVVGDKKIDELWAHVEELVAYKGPVFAPNLRLEG